MTVLWLQQAGRLVRRPAPGATAPPVTPTTKAPSAQVAALVLGSIPDVIIPPVDPPPVDPTPTDPPPVVNPTDARFPGDPGRGRFYLGGRPDTKTWPALADAITNWETKMAPWSGGKKLAIIRIYGDYVAGGMPAGDLTTIKTQWAAGRIVHKSGKYGGCTLADQANRTGNWAAWMDGMAAQLKSLKDAKGNLIPVWVTLHHEPENDTSTNTAAGQALYRRACRNFSLGLRERGVTNHAFVACCMMNPFTYGEASAFGSESTRDWRTWWPDWKGTTTTFPDGTASSKSKPNPADFYPVGSALSVVDVRGLDTYSYWDEGEPLTKWETFDRLHSFAYSRHQAAQPGDVPYVIAEHGVAAAHTGVVSAGTAVFSAANDQLTLDYITGLGNTCVAKNIVGMEIFNFSVTNDSWRLEIEDPHQARYHGYGLVHARPESVRPTNL